MNILISSFYHYMYRTTTHKFKSGRTDYVHQGKDHPYLEELNDTKQIIGDYIYARQLQHEETMGLQHRPKTMDVDTLKHSIRDVIVARTLSNYQNYEIKIVQFVSSTSVGARPGITLHICNERVTYM